MIVRSLGTSRLVLAMSPVLRDKLGDVTTVAQLAQCPTLSMSDAAEDHWQLVGTNDEAQVVAHRPRLMCSNTDMLNSAAIRGIGIALLPEHVTRPSFVSGALVQVLPEWCSPVGTVQAAFPTKKGLLPAVRALIDYLALEVPRLSAGVAPV